METRELVPFICCGDVKYFIVVSKTRMCLDLYVKCLILFSDLK